MKMNNKFKSYTFWVSLSSALVILVQSIAQLFGFSFETSIVENIIMAVCGVLVVLGIVNKPAQKNTEDEVVQDQTESETCNIDENDIQDN